MANETTKPEAMMKPEYRVGDRLSRRTALFFEDDILAYFSDVETALDAAKRDGIREGMEMIDLFRLKIYVNERIKESERIASNQRSAAVAKTHEYSAKVGGQILEEIEAAVRAKTNEVGQ